MNLPLSSYRGVFSKYLRPEWGRVALLALLLAGSIALQLISPQIIRYFIDSAEAGQPARVLALAALGFLAAGLAQRLSALGMLYLSENVGWAATNALRADLTRHVLRLDMSFHKQHTPGELIERIDGDVSTLAQFFAQFVVRVAGNALLIAGIVLVLTYENPRIGAALAAYAGLTLLALFAIQHVTARPWNAERQAAADTFGFLEERIAGVEDLQAAGAEEHSVRRLEDLLSGWARANVAAQTTNALTTAAAGWLGLAGSVLALGIGGYLYLRGGITIGTAYLVVSYVSLLAQPLDDLRNQAQGLGRASASLARVLALEREQSRIAATPGGTESPSLPGGALSVEFAGVSFAYNDAAAPPDGAPILTNGFALHDVSFCVPAGRVLGVLGRTGSGKTTLTRLLFRLYDPDAGRVSLAGADLCNLPAAEVRRRVGLVTQDVQLFQASVRDNLTFFDGSVSDARIADALRTLGLWEWVQRLPNGLDTRLLAGGQGLSAGQAQLLALGRVFLKDTGVVVLDEASSRLDPLTEGLLEAAVARLLAGRTGIIIAHRLQTVQRADDILILEAGHPVEHGARATLAADPGSRFSQLLKTGLEEALA